MQKRDPARVVEARAATRSVLRNTALLSLFFSAVVAAVLVLNWVQLETADPIDSPALATLRKQLAEDGANEVLRLQIRELDLMVRKAYFLKRYQLQTGSRLLAVGLALGALAGNLLYFHRKRYPDLSGTGTPPNPDRESLVNYLLMVAGVVLVGAIGIFAAVRGERAVQPETAQDAYAEDQPMPFTPAPRPKPDRAHPVPQQPARGLATEAEMASNWVAFRGLDGRATAVRETVPMAWDGRTGAGVVWKTPNLKPGYSSPIAWKGKLFMTGADTEARVVYCYNVADGTLLWEHAATGIAGSPAELPEVDADTGYAAPSMATDGSYVFALFATGDLLCLDMDGKRIWAQNLGVPVNHYGHSSSLVTYRNLLLVQYDHGDAAALIALDTGSGEEAWYTERKSDISWSSPLLVRRADGATLVINAAPAVCAYDAATGRELWRNACMQGEVGPSPTTDGTRIFVANDGASLFALDLQSGATLWENSDITMPDASSPLAVGKYVIVPTSASALACVDAETGKTLWEEYLDNGFYSSAIAINGKVYLCDLAGATYIFEPGPEFKLLAKPLLGEAIAATPVCVDGYLFLRGRDQLYCIGEKL